jgi:hypothetical protein
MEGSTGRIAQGFVKSLDLLGFRGGERGLAAKFLPSLHVPRQGHEGNPSSS